MSGRRAAVSLTAFALAALGGGVVPASTHDGHAKTQQRLRSTRTMSALVNAHVCHPGRAGSMLDSLQ